MRNYNFTKHTFLLLVLALLMGCSPMFLTESFDAKQYTGIYLNLSGFNRELFSPFESRSSNKNTEEAEVTSRAISYGPPDGGTVVVKDSNDTEVYNQAIDLSTAEALIPFISLPEGTGYTVTVELTLDEYDMTEPLFIGNATFDVTAGNIGTVELVLSLNETLIETMSAGETRTISLTPNVNDSVMGGELVQNGTERWYKIEPSLDVDEVLKISIAPDTSDSIVAIPYGALYFSDGTQLDVMSNSAPYATFYPEAAAEKDISLESELPSVGYETLESGDTYYLHVSTLMVADSAPSSDVEVTVTLETVTDKDENNNEPTTATPLSEGVIASSISSKNPNGYSVFSNSASLKDADCWNINLSTDGEIRLDLKATDIYEGNPSLFVDVYNSGGTTIVDDASFGVFNDHISLTIDGLTAGDYYAVIIPSGTTTGRYSIEWNYINSKTDDSYEENDSSDTAAALAADTIVSGVAWDEDWYSISLEAESEVKFFMDTTPSTVEDFQPVTAEVYESDGTTLVGSSFTDQMVSSLIAGDYYLRLVPDPNYQGTDYTLWWTTN